MRFVGLHPPARGTALAEVDVDGTRLDLHTQLRLVGLTYGAEPATATLGWAAEREVLRVRRGRALAVSGLALHFRGLRRFEIAFQAESPGRLEYFERRDDAPEAGELLFFFEGGTLRIAAEECRAELIFDEEEGGEAPESQDRSSDLLQ